jgi:uncharacterized protein YcaQ
LRISKEQARRFLLSYQGLNQSREFSGKTGVLKYIRRVGCIQYDPLDVVGQNPHLVLQARVADYQPGMLRELLYEDRQLLDGWDKNMSIYATEDWPYFERVRYAARNNQGRSAEAVRSILPIVRTAIEEHGPISSLDLEMNDIVDWSWTPTRLARAALESMYFWGELVVHHRIHTRKVYDFAYRCLPEDLLSIPDPNPIDSKFQDWYVQRRVGSVGLLWNRSGEAWLGMLSIKSKERKVSLERLIEGGKILQIEIEGFKEPFYIRNQDMARLEQSLNITDPQPRAVVIAPLDNLLWDRRLLKEMFYFDYRWEVYVPSQQRRYGYYVLPILYGDRFIARFEPYMDKTRGILSIKNWWWEPGVTLNEQMQFDLQQCFQRFLRYLGRDQLVVDRRSHEQADLAWLDMTLA